ncbi:MAG: glycoside hydrolase family 1 protein [bacterium]|nr:glycoside hydrolase family 1 protein [bacterium]MDZ4296115.1 glycoside hydrolase family 1 protein [Patescibacteria group bacterium]
MNHNDSRLTFPGRFYWGTATSAHQVEGNTQNDWSEWERSDARLGELRSRGANPADFISGRATDHYNRFREDFDIARQLGHNAHRFSIEWSRIEPEEGKFDEREIEHYREVIRALRERGIEPFVTLWHWTLPAWVHNQGGWENKKTAADFVRYAGRVVQEYRGLVHFWITLNEPSTYTSSAYLYGRFPPQAKSLWRARRVLRHLTRAHERLYRTIHELAPGAEVGVANYIVYHQPYGGGWRNRVLSVLVDYLRNWKLFNRLSKTQDFIGVNYYHRDVVAFKLGGKWGCVDIRNPNQWTGDNGWEIFPEGLYHVITRVAKYGKPIYITENGIADGKDAHRARFIQEHLAWMGKALEDGADVRGYLHWSLLDNFEWDGGFAPRFGLIEVNYETLERRIRESAYHYRNLIQGKRT